MTGRPLLPAGVTLRDATTADATALSVFAAEIFRETFGHSVSAITMSAFLGETYGELQQRSELEDADIVTVLAEDSAGIAGFFQLQQSSDAPGEATAPDEATLDDESRVPGEAMAPDEGSPLPTRRWIEVKRFYVDRRWHGRGLAAALMDAALARAHSLGATDAWLGVWEDNARAIAFYAKWGFVPVGSQSFRLGDVLQRDLVLARALP